MHDSFGVLTRRAALLALLLGLMLSSVASALPLVGRSQPAVAATQSAMAEQAILFGSDGMRPDMVEQYAAEGAMPTYAAMIASGAKGDNGMLQAAPPNTGVGWSTMATGAWPGTHGMTNNTFHVNGQSFTSRTSGYSASLRQAETLAEAAVRQGKKVAIIEWPASLPASRILSDTNTPIVDFRSFYSNRGVALNYDLPGGAEGAAEFGVQYDRITVTQAISWTNVPASFSPAQETSFALQDFGQPKYAYKVYIYDSTDDSTTNYDHALISPDKDGNNAVATLMAGEWANVKVTIIGGSDAGKMGGFWLKLIDLSPDLSQVRLYFTSVSRTNAFPASLSDYINNNLASTTAADYATLEAHIIDEETYVEQGLLWETTVHPIIEYILTTFQPDTDLAMVGYPVTDEFSHQFMALVTPSAEVYDDVDRDGVPDGRVEERTSFIRRSYSGADSTLALVKSLMPENTPVFAGADHGFAPIWKGINTGEVLKSIGLQTQAQTSNCRPRDATDKAKGCWAGGALQVYLYLQGRDGSGATVPAADYEAVRQQIADAFRNLTDPETGESVVAAVMMKEEARYIPAGEYGTTNMLFPTRTGDVVVFAKPPYQFDAAPSGMAVGDVPFFGQHGFLPDTVDLSKNINMHAAFFASGPSIRNMTVEKMRAIDIAPTMAYLLGLHGPAQATGKIRLDMFEGSTPEPTPSPLRYEAEDASLTAPMAVRAENSAEMCNYISTPVGTNSGQGQATFTVNVPASGTYYIWGRTWGPSSTQNSFFVQVDNGPRYTWDIPGLTGWAWHYVTNRVGSTAQILSFNLSAGSHTITVTNREGGSRLDALELTRDPAHRPTDVGCRQGLQRDKALIEIAAWSDFHGQLQPINRTVDGISTPVGGAAQIASIFEEWRTSRNYDQIRLSGGDNVGASPPISRYFGDVPTIDVMNAMDWTASSFGNHEFDDGVDHLKMLVERSTFDWLAANVVISGTTQIDDWYKAVEIYEVDGVTVGIIGVELPTTPELVTPGATGNYQFLEFVETVQMWEPVLRQQGAQVVGVITHIGSDRGTVATNNWQGPIIDAVNALPAGTLDFVVAGHTHRPTNAIINDTLIVQTTNAGQDLVDAVLVVDRETGEVEYKTASTLIPYSIGVRQDPAVKAIVDDAAARIAPIANEIIGLSSTAIPRTTRSAESKQGNLVADALRLTYNTDVALTNSGGLRADLTNDQDMNGAGQWNIRRGYVLSVLPFGNTGVVATYTGAQIKAALENGVSRISVVGGQPSGNDGAFPQISGMTFRYDPTRAAGDRVLEIRITSKGRNEVMDPNASYTLATNDFLFYGGDRYTVLTQGTNVQLRGDILAELVERFIAANSPVNPTIEGRITAVIP